MVIQVAVIGVITVFLGVYLKQTKPEYGFVLSLAATIIIVFFIISKLSSVMEIINRIENIVNVDSEYVKILFKMIGISYVGEFAGNICKDAGFSSVAQQIEVFAKVSIVYMSMPVVLSLLEMIGRFF